MPDREDIAAAFAAAIETPLLWRGILAIVAVLTFFLPWVTLDGDTASTHGASLIANMFHGSARGHMLSASFIGGASLLILPILIAVVTFAGTLRTTMGYDAIGYNISALALIFLLLLAADPVTNTSHIMFGNMVRPQWGLYILPLTQVALTTHSLWAKYFPSRDKPWDTTSQESDEDTSPQRAPRRPQGNTPNDTNDHGDDQRQVAATALLTPAAREQHSNTPDQGDSPTRPTGRMPEQQRRKFSDRMSRLPEDRPIDRAP